MERDKDRADRILAGIAADESAWTSERVREAAALSRQREYTGKDNNTKD